MRRNARFRDRHRRRTRGNHGPSRTNRNRRASLTFDKHWGPTTAQVLADSTDTFFGDTHRINRHLPLLRLARTPQKDLHTGVVWSYEARGERLGAGQILKLLCRDPGAPADLPAWCRLTGHQLLWADEHTFYIQRKEAS